MEGIIRIGEGDALAAIDTTTDFYPAFGAYRAGAFPVSDAHRCIDVTNWLLRLSWAERILGFDCHPPNHLSFRIFPVHGVKDTPGADLHPAIKRGPYKRKGFGWFDLMVPKATRPKVDAFSAFFDLEGQPVAGGKLQRHLAARKVRRLFIIGNEIMHCVMDTGLHALRLGYETFIIRDAVGAFTLRSGQFALRHLEEAGARIISSYQLQIG